MNERIFAIGDIHGCYNSFQQLVEQKIELRSSDKLILLGDYIDRGYQCKEVIDFIIDKQNKGFNIIPLMGNHETMLLNTINDEAELSKWIINGGSETLKSFNVKSPKEIDQVYIDFFNSLSFYYAHDDFLFVHAGFNDDVNNPFDDKSLMIWECRKVYNNPALKNKTIIHGHRPIKAADCDERIHSNSNVINIDTGCVYSDRPGYGRLTSLELNTKCVFFV